jgi:hypothetical protein
LETTRAHVLKVSTICLFPFVLKFNSGSCSKLGMFAISLLRVRWGLSDKPHSEMQAVTGIKFIRTTTLPQACHLFPASCSLHGAPSMYLARISAYLFEGFYLRRFEQNNHSLYCLWKENLELWGFHQIKTLWCQMIRA